MCSLSQARIIYYSQEKYFRHVQQAAAMGLEKFSNDPVLQFFKAYGVFREGKDLSVLASRPGYYPSTMATPGCPLPVMETILHSMPRSLG